MYAAEYKTSTPQYLTAKSVDLRLESSSKSTSTFHFTLLACKRSTHKFFLDQLVEHLIPILQSLRFESSHELTQTSISSLDTNFFFLCPAGRADGEVLRSKVRILIVVDPAFFLFLSSFSAQALHTSAYTVSDSKIGRSEVGILIIVDKHFSFHAISM